VLKAEGEKQAQILEAEGRREAAFRDAEARERAAMAEAEATRVVSEAIATSGTQALNYFIAQKYTEAVGQFAQSPNAKTILFPVEATNLIGSLGGIGELVKDALGDGGAPRPQQQPTRQARPSVPPSLPSQGSGQ
jgi:regulator of protease activity HflC (stomatin/prohibitin superfamily)